MPYCRRALIESIYSVKSGEECVSFYRGYECRVVNCYIGPVMTGINPALEGRNFVIANCIFNFTGAASATAIGNGAARSITNCYFFNCCGTNGLQNAIMSSCYIDVKGRLTTGVVFGSNATIVGCTIVGAEHGIGMRPEGASNVIITGCMILQPLKHGIWLRYNATHVSITDCTIIDPGWDGIAITGFCEDVLIQSCYITQASKGISIIYDYQANASSYIITDNIIKSNGYGIYVDLPSGYYLVNSIITENVLADNSSGNIVGDIDTATCVIANNKEV